MSTQAISAAPCAKCPFRKDVPVYLRPERREEIVRGLIDDHGFACHEHVVWTEDDDGRAYVESEGPMCAGAAKALLNSGGSTNLMRIAERLGLADLDRTADRGPDVWDLSVWPLVPEGETAATWDPDEADEVETCSTVNAGCLAPAGFMGAGGTVVSGTVAADGECAECGEPLCSNCADAEGLCGMCSEDDEEDW